MIRRTRKSRHWSKTALRVAALVTVVCIGPACIRMVPLQQSFNAYLCDATIVNDRGWTEVLDGGDPDVVGLLDDQTPLLWDHCEESEDNDSRLLHWRRVLTDIVNAGGDDSFRGHPGTWQVYARGGEAGESVPVLSCYLARTESRYEGPECFETSSDPLGIADPVTECLEVSPLAIDFGAQATFSEAPSETIAVRNNCAHPIEVVVDDHVTCHDDWVRECVQCADGDPDCKPDFNIETDCVPVSPGDLSLTLEGSADPDGSRCAITVDFSPQARGPRLAQKVVSTADTGESYVVALEGSGVGGTAVLEGGDAWCWDATHLIGDCVHEGNRANLVVSNGATAGAVVVHGVALDRSDDVGFRILEESWYRAGSDDPRSVEYPLNLDPGDSLSVVVHWCLTLSNPPGGEEPGKVDEHALLRITTDDPAGSAFDVPFHWSAEACL